MAPRPDKAKGSDDERNQDQDDPPASAAHNTPSKFSSSSSSSTSFWSGRGLLLLGVAFHAVYVLSIFDIYFKTPVVPNIKSMVYSNSLAVNTDETDPATIEPPAKRVIVFVGDGCRADKLFELVQKDKPRAPFLREIMEERGSWGISHTRVPTESRPGHVALFAGMYEDVSAITKGWQVNPVDFDSVFNQSKHSWLFGSPDIVSMFTRQVDHATEHHYAAHDQDFAHDASQLDHWVHKKFQELLNRAQSNQTLNDQLHSDGVVVFCHFLGLDTNGHAFRPQSNEYLRNIELVDDLIRQTYQMVERFYGNDGKTAYVFTADHGMSNKGSHGDGEPANTRTPLVVWGAGVQPPVSVDSKADPTKFHIDLPTQSKKQILTQLQAQVEEETSALNEWGSITKLVRRDVMQADIAALISGLLGLPFPRNSVGVLPFGFLKKTPFRARAVWFNARQMYQHALQKNAIQQNKKVFYFKPYRQFQQQVPTLRETLQQAFAQHEFETVETNSQELIEMCLNTVTYLQQYDWMFLFSVIIAGYVGWLGVLLVSLDDGDLSYQKLFVVLSDVLFVVSAFLAVMYLVLESSPVTYYLYVGFPVVFWCFLIRQRAVVRKAVRQHVLRTSFLLIVVAIEMICIGYSHRVVFGVLFLGLPFALTRVAAEDQTCSARSTLKWRLSCLLLGVFPFLPAEYGEHTSLVVFGGMLLLCGVACACLFKKKRAFSTAGDIGSDKQLTQKGIVIDATLLKLVVLVVLSMVCLVVTMLFLGNKQKPPMWLTLANWMVSLVPIGLLLLSVNGGWIGIFTWLTSWLPFCRGTCGKSRAMKIQTDFGLFQDESELHRRRKQRLVEVMLALMPAYLLLSISYEVVFYAVLCFALYNWIDVDNVTEPELTSPTARERARAVKQRSGSTSFDDNQHDDKATRGDDDDDDDDDHNSSSHRHRNNSLWQMGQIAFVYLLFIKMAFFGTGNIASISSFEISSTYRFVTMFSPFLMGTLLVLKILIPFLLVTCALVLLCGFVHHNPVEVVVFVVVFNDLMAVQFLFGVQNYGSWKEIGNSISTFVIVNAMIVFIPLLFLLARGFCHDLFHFETKAKTN